MILKAAAIFEGCRVFRPILLVAGLFLVTISALCALPAHSAGDEFKVAIMQPQKGAAQKYRSLEKYLQTQDVKIRFVGASSYTAAAKMFADGVVDGMFSGSGVAGSMLIKEIALPVLRPEDQQGLSTYWAVVVAPKGSLEFTDNADYFRGKKIILCSLASSGEFFYRAIPEIGTIEHSVIIAPSHGAALLGLSKGVADVAIVKNRVWDNMKDRYPNLQMVGRDFGENPNATLIVSKKADPKLIEKFTAALYALETSPLPEAKQVLTDLGIRRYLATGPEDFAHTLQLLGRSGVNKNFNFTF